MFLRLRRAVRAAVTAAESPPGTGTYIPAGALGGYVAGGPVARRPDMAGPVFGVDLGHDNTATIAVMFRGTDGHLYLDEVATVSPARAMHIARRANTPTSDRDDSEGRPPAGDRRSSLSVDRCGCDVPIACPLRCPIAP